MLPYLPSDSCALCQWYTGPTLLQALDTFKDPPRRIDAPLRAVITSVISENTKGGQPLFFVCSVSVDCFLCYIVLTTFNLISSILHCVIVSALCFSKYILYSNTASSRIAAMQS